MTPKVGDDLVHGGNGRDIISGGMGADELHGDFGWYTYIDQRDGAEDLIAVKSDQFLHNYWYESSGNINSAIRQMSLRVLIQLIELRSLG